ncbi:endo- -alpha-mannosidase [Moniliophthora roreri MCA 2997]|uniref:Endo--alpha-mannosidase n=1 Tax=Moniliophthora roreri (strain MCA 2997) TaxID=1381753 RepID=V2WMT6_MONRO|nr:endo- -alpha-mannosidase [Moniliophthora roreri MCA 2997]
MAAKALDAVISLLDANLTLTWTGPGCQEILTQTAALFTQLAVFDGLSNQMRDASNFTNVIYPLSNRSFGIAAFYAHKAYGERLFLTNAHSWKLANNQVLGNEFSATQNLISPGSCTEKFKDDSLKPGALFDGYLSKQNPDEPSCDGYTNGLWLKLSALLYELTSDRMLWEAAEASATFIKKHMIRGRVLYVRWPQNCTNELVGSPDSDGSNSSLFIEGLAIQSSKWKNVSDSKEQLEGVEFNTRQGQIKDDGTVDNELDTIPGKSIYSLFSVYQYLPSSSDMKLYLEGFISVQLSACYMLVAGIGLPEVSSTDVTSSSLPGMPSHIERNAKVPVGGIAGGAVGGVALVAIITGTCIVCMRRKRQTQAFASAPFTLQVQDTHPVSYDETAPTHWHVKSRVTDRRNGNEAMASGNGLNAISSSAQPALTLAQQGEPAQSESDIGEPERHVDSGWRPHGRVEGLPPAYLDATRSIRSSSR